MTVVFLTAVFLFWRQVGLVPLKGICGVWRVTKPNCCVFWRQVGLVPLIMTSHYRRYGCYDKARVIFDIHNMGYCGNFGALLTGV